MSLDVHVQNLGLNYINLPNCIYCEECQKKHNLRDNLYIIYKVI